MFQIAICDNDREFCYNLKGYIEKELIKQNEDFNIFIFNKYDELVQYLMEKNTIDLLFLEIEMNECNGIGIGSFIRENMGNYSLQLVYLSYEQEYAMQLFKTEPMDFIIKPVNQVQINHLIKRFLKKKTGLDDVIVFKQKYGTVRMSYSSILYFKSMNHKILVCSLDGQNEFYGKLTDVEQYAPEYFIRIHKSYLVNKAFICSVYYDSVILKDSQKLPVSRSCREVVERYLTELRNE